MAWGTPTSLAASVGTGSAAHSLSSGTLSASAGTLVVVTGGMIASVAGDAIVVSDSASNTWTVFSTFRGSSKAGAFIAYSILANTITNGTITVADTSNAGTNFTACGFQAFSVTGGASSSIEDSTARGSNNGAATTSPTVTSGTPGVAGDLFFSTYCSAGSNAGAYTEDAGNGWTTAMLKAGTASGTTITSSSGYQVNAGTGTLTHAPTTSNFAYAQVVAAFKVASGGRTGSGAITEGSDVLAGSGQLKITASAAIVEGNDVPAGSGKVRITGSGAIGEGNDSFAATGELKITGVGAIAESSDTLAASGELKITSTGAIVEPNDTLAGSGSVASGTITGTGAIVEGSDTFAASGSSGGVVVSDIDWIVRNRRRRRG